MADERVLFLQRLEPVLRRAEPTVGLRHEDGPFPALVAEIDGAEVLRVIAVTAPEQPDVAFTPYPFPGTARWQFTEGRHTTTTFDAASVARGLQRAARRLAPVPPLVAPDGWQPPALASRLADVGWSGDELPDSPDPQALAGAGLDLADLDRDRIATGFPRDDRGAAVRSTVVLLQPLDQPGRGRQQWLAVRATRKNELALAQVGVHPANAAHRWDAEAWRWDARLPWPERPIRWGADSDEDRARQARRHLRAGDFAAGLELFGIGHEPDLARLLAGRPMVDLEEGCAPQDPVWGEELADVLSRLAPWRLHRALPDGSRRGRILTFSGQTPARKVGLQLVRRGRAGRLTLDLAATGSHARLPDTLVRRSLQEELEA